MPGAGDASFVCVLIAAAWRPTYAFAMGKRNRLTRGGTAALFPALLLAGLLASALLMSALPARAGDDRPAAGPAAKPAMKSR